MSTVPTPAPPAPAPATIPTWISLILNLGASLGASFIQSTKVGQLIELAASTTTQIINAVQQAKVSNSSAFTVPLFVGVLQDALAGAVIAGKLTAAQANELNKALVALSQEDAAAKAAVDYTTIGPIQPLP